VVDQVGSDLVVAEAAVQVVLEVAEVRQEAVDVVDQVVIEDQEWEGKECHEEAAVVRKGWVAERREVVVAQRQ